LKQKEKKIMAFKKPVINTIKPDIKNVSIYLRSVKKFGKSTLFRDMIIEKYGDPSRGLLVEIGMERGDALLDNLNTTHVDTYRDLMDLQKWLIETKGVEHNIEIVGFDVADEIVPIFDKETIRQHNIENPQKQVKSVKAAMGGYTAGEQYSATLMKNYFDKIKSSGMQIWVLGHSKYKNIKDKANVDNEGYMQLSSNLSATYEAALGDIFDVVLTGIIDRNIETVGSGDDAKRYATDAIRKLYFRGTPEIDAGVRFAADTVPEYLVFDKPNMAADFIRIIEEGMEKSKTCVSGARVTATVTSTPTSTPIKTPVVVEDPVVDDEPADDLTVDDVPFDVEDSVDEPAIDVDALCNDIRDAFKAAGAAKRGEVKAVMTANGVTKLDSSLDVDVLQEIANVLGL
jgi:hypothetical protein